MKIKEIQQDQMIEGKHYICVTFHNRKNYYSTIKSIGGELEIYEFYEGIWIDTEIEANDKILEVEVDGN